MSKILDQINETSTSYAESIKKSDSPLIFLNNYQLCNKEAKDFLTVNDEEFLFFSIIFNLALSDCSVTASDLASRMEIPNIDFIKKIHVLETLKEKGLISIEIESSSFRRLGISRKHFSLSAIKIHIPREIASDIITGENINIQNFQSSEYKKLEVLMKLNAVINDTEKTILSRASLINRIIKLLKQYENDDIVKNITSYELSNIQTVTLILLIIKALEDDNPSMEVKDIVNVITDNLTEKMLAFEELTDTNTGIFTNNLVELNNSFFNDDKEIKLVNESFLSIIGIENHKLFKTKKNKPVNKSLLTHDSIQYKELYYSKSVRKQMENIKYSLMPENFDRLTTLFSENKFIKGLNILLYGKPGTGKTETVLQLAKATKRNIKWVNLSTIKSSWYGESEKNIKALFDDYRVMMRKEEITPILFFNEADAILNTRVKVERSIDQVSNAIQNIILQEMEQFDGILIATTNLIENFDEAFNRRFLFKIELDEPDKSSQYKIWMNRFPFLKKYECEMLCDNFNFTGAIIENIHKKLLLDSFLNNYNISFNSIMLHCEEEQNMSSAIIKINKAA